MKITKLELKNFKYFTDLNIKDIPKEAEMVLLVGPNGTGKSCIFDAFNFFAFISKRNTETSDDEYYKKDIGKPFSVSLFDENGIKIERPAFEKRKINFYGRSSYRFTSKINRDSISTGVANKVLNDQDAPVTYAELDQRIENDIEKALGEFIQAVQAQTGKTDIEIVGQVIGKVNESLKVIFSDPGLQLIRIVDPHSDPKKAKIDLEFSKNGNLFGFRNLSSGEKEVVDIIFNFHRRKDSWIRDGVYFIDEPELHLNTKIQALLLKELHRLCKETNAQLWVATHSLGFLREAHDMKQINKDLVAIIEFKPEFANYSQPINPITGTRRDWQRIFQTALEDITGLVAPKQIIYCEGKIQYSLDEKMFNLIFEETHNDTLFIASGNKDAVQKNAAIALTVLNKAFTEVGIIALVDRDDDLQEIKSGFVKVKKLKRREFENYLLDEEIIKLYCSKNNLTFNQDEYNKLVSSITNDDVKSLAQDILSKSCGGSYNKDTRIELADSIKLGTKVFQELETEIFS